MVKTLSTRPDAIRMRAKRAEQRNKMVKVLSMTPDAIRMRAKKAAQRIKDARRAKIPDHKIEPIDDVPKPIANIYTDFVFVQDTLNTCSLGPDCVLCELVILHEPKFDSDDDLKMAVPHCLEGWTPE